MQHQLLLGTLLGGKDIKVNKTWSPHLRKVCKKIQCHGDTYRASGQDEGVGRHSVPPHTTKRKITTI